MPPRAAVLDYDRPRGLFAVVDRTFGNKINQNMGTVSYREFTVIVC